MTRMLESMRSAGVTSGWALWLGHFTTKEMNKMNSRPESNKENRVATTQIKTQQGKEQIG